ncbi:hypothetical protein YC2023_045674 [Brassica napus]
MSRHVHCLNPIRWRKLCLEEKTTNGIVDGSYHPLRFPILLGGVRTRESNIDAIIVEMIHKSGIVVFSSIIALKSFD